MYELKKMLETNTPFAVMQYFESFKGAKRETHKKYEVLYLKERIDRKTNELKRDFSFRILTNKEVIFFKQNIDKIKLIINDEDGQVYEFNNFKEYKVLHEALH
jgi:hypothetical protein